MLVFCSDLCVASMLPGANTSVQYGHADCGMCPDKINADSALALGISVKFSYWKGQPRLL